MHSSIINKIRILKPRKKVQSKNIKLRNENLHILTKDKNDEDELDSVPPPLINQKTDEGTKVNPTIYTAEKTQKWLPFYIVNVSKNDITPNTSNTNITAIPISKSTKSNSYTISTRSKCNNDNSPEKCNQENIVNSMKEIEESSNEKYVSCFLCPEIFQNVEAMQTHYLDKHKQKKRISPLVSKTKHSKKYFKPIKPKGTSNIEEDAKCPICSICFKSEQEVNEHMANVHVYKCSECQNTFYTLYQFTDHKCSQTNKVKKVRTRKRKAKKAEKDPLLVSPSLARIENETNTSIQDSNINKTIESITLLKNDTFEPKYVNANVNNNTLIYQSTNSLNTYDRPITSINCDLIDSSQKTVNAKKSWLDFSLEKLTSEEFNKMKLKELYQNPNLSVNWLPKMPVYSKQELYTCGRCNVLCEDTQDYLEHIEECLRLSNVSLVSTTGPPNKILKLKSELMPRKRVVSYGINKKLLKALSNFIDAENIETLNSDQPLNKPFEKEINNGANFHPDIKGNIYIEKCLRNKDVILGGSQPNRNSLPLNLKLKNNKQPMVMIPIDKSLMNQTSGINNTQSKNDHYPEITIIDKNNRVTYNFLISEPSPVLKYEPIMSKNKNTLTSNIKVENEITLKTSTSTTTSEDNYQEALAKIRKSLLKQAFQLKPEPSISSLQTSADSVNSKCKEENISFDLILAEDEIKMEVEDEDVDDTF